ncbi:hypothetical protein [Nostoc sp.]|uniref:hypothetical protein n=1 Tax=Nostoc sp. TaxID=1180 RepID=UPI002FF83C2E
MLSLNWRREIATNPPAEFDEREEFTQPSVQDIDTRNASIKFNISVGFCSYWISAVPLRSITYHIDINKV